MKDFELRLIGHRGQDGQILAQDMVSLAGAAQSLITRLARSAAERDGPGRSEAALEALSRVLLTGLRPGSTRLSFAYGDAQSLPLDDTLSAEVEREFWRIVDALPADARPPGVSDLVAEAVSELVGALRRASPTVEFSSPARPPVRLRTGSLHREVWAPALFSVPERRTLIGKLEMLDLKNDSFRIVDDATNRIPLKEVRDAHDAARNVDQYIAATGTPVMAADGRLRHLVDVVVEGVSQPESWTRPQPDPATILGSRPRTTEGGIDLSDREFDDFMAALRA